MTTEQPTLSVTILDKKYIISCPEEEHKNLNEAAFYLDKKMRDIRKDGRIVGMDRIAIMAALNIANDYLIALTDKESTEKEQKRYSENVELLTKKLENALAHHY